MSSWLARLTGRGSGRAAEVAAKSVWYLEGRHVSGGDIARDAQMGSAVMVKLERLRRDDGTGATRWKPHDPPDIGQYLLTCAHVVADPDGGHFGEIIAWQPGAKLQHWPSDATPRRSRMGVGDIGGHLVQPSLGPTMAQDGVLATPARAYNDWVLLAFDAEPPGVVAHGAAVERWADFNARGRYVAIAGYPGGATGWATGHTIEATLVSGFHVKRKDDGQGHLVLSGANETRAGMSGGGVFLPDGALAGLHRAAFDASMERYSVAGQNILAWLADRGMRPPPARARSYTRPLLGAGAVALLGAIGASVVTWWPDPPVAKVCVQVHIGERALGTDGKMLVQLPMEGLRLTLKGDWLVAPVHAPPTDVNGLACFAPVTLKRDDGAKTFPFRIHNENVPGVLSAYAPLMVVPHGVEADGRRRGTDPDLAQFVNTVSPIPLMVMGQATAQADRLSGAIQGPEAAGGKQNLDEDIKTAAQRESLAPAERDRAVQAWATILQQSRPVIPAATWSSKNPDKHGRVVAAVGVYFENGVRITTGFVFDRNSVIVPAFAVSKGATRRWIIFGERPGANPLVGRVELGEVRLGTIAPDVGGRNLHRIAIIEARGALPPAPTLSTLTMDAGTASRSIAVIGFPERDLRNPPAFQKAMASNYGVRSAMLGQAWQAGSSRKFAYQIDHDANTTGGTAGSPVVDVATGDIVAMHMGGFFDQSMYKMNFAVAMPDILKQSGVLPSIQARPDARASASGADRL